MPLDHSHLKPTVFDQHVSANLQGVHQRYLLSGGLHREPRPVACDAYNVMLVEAYGKRNQLPFTQNNVACAIAKPDLRSLWILHCMSWGRA